VCLPVTFGTEENIRTEYLTFEVADFRSSYHTIFGRPMLAMFMAIPHHTYLIMKMPVPNRILGGVVFEVVSRVVSGLEIVVLVVGLKSQQVVSLLGILPLEFTTGMGGVVALKDQMATREGGE
jgi:hypothetical protein